MPMDKGISTRYLQLVLFLIITATLVACSHGSYKSYYGVRTPGIILWQENETVGINLLNPQNKYESSRIFHQRLAGYQNEKFYLSFSPDDGAKYAFVLGYKERGDVNGLVLNSRTAKIIGKISENQIKEGLFGQSWKTQSIEASQISEACWLDKTQLLVAYKWYEDIDGGFSGVDWLVFDLNIKNKWNYFEVTKYTRQEYGELSPYTCIVHSKTADINRLETVNHKIILDGRALNAADTVNKATAVLFEDTP